MVIELQSTSVENKNNKKASVRSAKIYINYQNFESILVIFLIKELRAGLNTNEMSILRYCGK